MKKKVPFKRNHTRWSIWAECPFLENNTYLWVELKENSEGKHRLFCRKL